MKNTFSVLLMLVLVLSFPAFSLAADEADFPVKATVNSDGQNHSGNDCTAGFVLRDSRLMLAANCIEKGLTCVLNGTPCCAPYECKGKFPNTYCQ